MEKIRLFGILHIIGNIIRKEIKMDVIKFDNTPDA